jgi:hypothetical protein
MTAGASEDKSFAVRSRLRHHERLTMLARQIVIGSLLSLALLSLMGSVLPAASGQLDYCKADAERLCPGVPMGGGRIVGCLKEHKMEVSVGCAKAIQHIKAEMGK